MKTTSEMERALIEGSMTPAEAREGLCAILEALEAEFGADWLRARLEDAIGAPELPEATARATAYGVSAVEAAIDLCEAVTTVVEMADHA